MHISDSSFHEAQFQPYMEPTRHPFPTRQKTRHGTRGLQMRMRKRGGKSSGCRPPSWYILEVRGRGKGQIEFFVLLFRLGHSCSTVYASTVTRPLGLVTLTPRALALAMMSTRLREETAEAILSIISINSYCGSNAGRRTQQRRCGCA
jgi:hypothetical protein